MLSKYEITPVNEKPIHMPRVPPTDPIIEITSYIKYSLYTVVVSEDKKSYTNVKFVFFNAGLCVVTSPEYSRVLHSCGQYSFGFSE